MALFTIILYAVSGSEGGISDGGSNGVTLYCSGGGSVQFFDGSVASAKILWDSQLFLSITLGFGHFTFAQAKALDFAWDLLIGTGGQLGLMALVYPLFRRVFLSRMESRPLPGSVYTALVFDRISGTTVFALLGALFPARTTWHLRLPQRRFTRYWGMADQSSHAKHVTAKPLKLGHGLLYISVLFAMAYLLAFAKVLSLMTGY
jgi:hypothetical protein